MKNYSIFHPLYMSFYSKNLYRDVVKNWRGVAAGYLLLLLAIVWLPVAIQLTAKLKLFINEFTTEDLSQWVAQVPIITIKQGVISIDKPQPYFIKNPKNGNIVVIFDNTGHYTNLDETTATILVTRNKIIYRKDEQEIREYSFEKGEEGVIDQAFIDKSKYYIDKFVHSMLWWVPPLLYILMIMASFIYRLIQALLYALVGFIYSRFIKYEIQYQPTYRLTIIALTPVIILSSILSYLHILFPLQWLLYLVIGLAYVIFAVRVNKESEVAPIV